MPERKDPFSRVRIRRTRDPIDMIFKKPFVVARRYPGGREAIIAKERTRPQAVQKARTAVRTTGAGGAERPTYSGSPERGPTKNSVGQNVVLY
jgi:hypothetical protein